MLEKLNTRFELNRLLQERNDRPDQTDVIDRQIQEAFERDVAVLVLDMSGFSRLTLRYGIIHFLSMIHRMTTIAAPLVKQHGGMVIKQEADNLFAAFDDVPAAVDTAVNILQAFRVVNQDLPDEHDIHASIGIGYGKTLIVDDHDLYGCEMNLACKLGEDLARRGEILLTEAAYDRLTSEPGRWEKLELSFSELELTAYKLRR